jgi:hypothetical protein
MNTTGLFDIKSFTSPIVEGEDDRVLIQAQSLIRSDPESAEKCRGTYAEAINIFLIHCCITDTSLAWVYSNLAPF